jgi:hypothetical protein
MSRKIIRASGRCRIGMGTLRSTGFMIPLNTAPLKPSVPR